MVKGLILIEGNNVNKEELRRLGLSNAKQIVGESYPGFGTIFHIAANTSTDLTNALLKLGQVVGVSKVTTLALNFS